MEMEYKPIVFNTPQKISKSTHQRLTNVTPTSKCPHPPCNLSRAQRLQMLGEEFIRPLKLSLMPGSQRLVLNKALLAHRSEITSKYRTKTEVPCKNVGGGKRTRRVRRVVSNPEYFMSSDSISTFIHSSFLRGKDYHNTVTKQVNKEARHAFLYKRGIVEERLDRTRMRNQRRWTKDLQGLNQEEAEEGEVGSCVDEVGSAIMGKFEYLKKKKKNEYLKFVGRKKGGITKNGWTSPYLAKKKKKEIQKKERSFKDKKSEEENIQRRAGVKRDLEGE